MLLLGDLGGSARAFSGENALLAVDWEGGRSGGLSGGREGNGREGNEREENVKEENVR